MQQRSIRYTRWLVSALGGALLLSSAACDDKITNSLGLVASSITVSAASNGQVGVVGQPLAQPIVVHVSDQNGASIGNAVVAWTIISGGGSVSQASSLTDVDGNASVTWTLGADGGHGFPAGSDLVGRVCNHHGDRDGGHWARPRSRSAATISPFSQARRRHRWWCSSIDAAGAPVANATVTWTATGNGSLGSTTTTTDANGMTQTTLTTVVPHRRRTR